MPRTRSNELRKIQKNKNECMSKVTEYFKDMIQTKRFSKECIDLTSKIGKGYAKVNVLSKYYSKDKIDQY